MLGDIQVITLYIVFQGQHVVSAKKVPGQPELHEILPFLPKKSKMDNHKLNNKPLLSFFRDQILWELTSLWKEVEKPIKYMK